MPSPVDDLVEAAASELAAGRAIIIPTDTVYGLAVLPEHLELLFELKQRPRDKAVAILVAQPADAETVFNPHPLTRTLMEAFWPGALTIVQDGKGVRCPDHPLVRAIATATGPIATTSANLSGQPTPQTAAKAASYLPDVGLVIDGGSCRGEPSTVVEVAAEGFEILREGAISAADLTNVSQPDGTGPGNSTLKSLPNG